MPNYDPNEIEKVLHYSFKNKDLLKLAFTHSSFANQSQIESNQRLEYLGDSIINFVVAEYLFKNFQVAEGKLSKMRAKYVSSAYLSEVINKSGLFNFLLLGQSFLNQNIPSSIKEDLFESLVGAIYLDSNFERVKKFILRFIQIKNNENKDKDYKTKLQEEIQKYKGAKLVYVTLEDPTKHGIFNTKVCINDTLVSKAQSSSKKKSQNECAKRALENTKKLNEILKPKIK